MGACVGGWVHALVHVFYLLHVHYSLFLFVFVFIHQNNHKTVAERLHLVDCYLL